MAVFKCKMCGGDLDIGEGITVSECEYCGTKQTLPRLDNEKKVNLYARANHFRRNNDYDKATGIYEQILNEDTCDSEAYWSLVLCRFGIEYVSDPATQKRVPTVNRAQYTSIFDDEDYKSALKYADDAQKLIYENEAQVINEIQKGILTISQKEEPFDVFICYKETDNNGRRTPDSVLATELYHELVRDGFKVFFSRITLEDKLGQEYEPYIFAALNSSKVMVVLGTKAEYFNAVWVKNEWSRYLTLIKNGARKILIPAYKDMDPYDLPDQFSHLQAQDMSRLGFMQDLIRGIEKIAVKEQKAITASAEIVTQSIGANIQPLLKRAFMFLEDGEFERADEFCEQVLNIDPECALGYLGKMMAQLKVRKQEKLKDCAKPFDHNNNYQKVLRFADESLKSELVGYIKTIRDRIENERLENVYKTALTLLETAEYEDEYENAAQKFKSISGYKDADQKAIECTEKAQIAKEENARREKRAKIITIIITLFLLAVIAVACLFSGYILPNVRYKKAVVLMEDGQYEEAKNILYELDGFKDSQSLLVECTEKSTVVENKKLLKECEVGDLIYWGSYEQDDDTANKEDIRWEVLEKTDDKVLVLSEKVLDAQTYQIASEVFEFNDWEDSYVRWWLNNAFINEAFSDFEKQSILTSKISTDGKETKDKIFLLNIDEAKEYIAKDSLNEVCYATEYAQRKLLTGYQDATWWLRGKGETGNAAVYVDYAGTVNTTGRNIKDECGVRPAMWISIK